MSVQKVQKVCIIPISETKILIFSDLFRATQEAYGSFEYGHCAAPFPKYIPSPQDFTGQIHIIRVCKANDGSPSNGSM